MHKDAIRYKDVLVLKGSDLWNHLTMAAAAKDPKISRELQDKAKKSYTATIERFNKLTGG